MDVADEEIPADLHDDAEIFRLMAVGQESVESAVPDDLEAKLRAMINEEPEAGAARKRKFTWLRMAGWATAAAAAVLIGFTFVPAGRQADVSTIESGVNAADDVAAVEADHLIDDCDAYIEITDPEEAARLAEEAFALIRTKMAAGRSPLEKTDGKLRKLNFTINRILHNKSLKTS